MDTVQMPTNASDVLPVLADIRPDGDIVLKTPTLKQMQYVDFCAMQGLVTDADGQLRTITVGKFAEMLGVGRQTLYDWQKAIPDFWDVVRKRRMELSKNTRASKVYNGLYLKACKGDPAAVKLWAEIFDGYQPPAQKHDVKISGLGELVNMARKKGVIEGEVVSDGH